MLRKGVERFCGTDMRGIKGLKRERPV